MNAWEHNLGLQLAARGGADPSAHAGSPGLSFQSGTGKAGAEGAHPAASGPQLSLPSHLMFPFQVDPTPLPNHQTSGTRLSTPNSQRTTLVAPEPSGRRFGNSHTAPAAGGDPSAPSGRPRSISALRVFAATPARAEGAEEAQQTYLRGQGADTRVFKLNLAFGRDLSVSVSLSFFNLLLSSAPKTTSFTS